MSLNQSFISDSSEYSRCSQKTKIKYKLHYGSFNVSIISNNGKHNHLASQIHSLERRKSFRFPRSIRQHVNRSEVQFAQVSSYKTVFLRD